MSHLLLIRPISFEDKDAERVCVRAVVERHGGKYDGWDAVVGDCEKTYQWWFYFENKAHLAEAQRELLEMGFKLGEPVRM